MKRLLESTGLVAGLLLLLIISSCVKDETNYRERELQLIEEFMLDQGYDITPLASGLYYKDVIVGAGETVQALDTVEVYYSGFYLSGIQFDSNVGGDLLRFVVQDDPAWVIDGFDEAMTYMSEGGEAFVIIPSWLGYGTGGSGPIPGYTPLIFELELVNIYRGPASE